MATKIISEDDCIQILRNYFEGGAIFELKDYSITEINCQSTELRPQHFILKFKVKKDVDETISFYVKKIPEGDSELNYTSLNKEINLYSTIDKVGKMYRTIDVGSIPKYYYGKEGEFVVLEDLVEKCYFNNDIRSDSDLTHLKLALQTAAKFHAITLVFEELKSLELGRSYKITEEYNDCWSEISYSDYKWIESALNALCCIIDLLPSECSSFTTTEFKTKLSQLAKDAYVSLESAVKFKRNVWCHGQLFIENIMFYYENNIPVSCKILDFKFQRYAPPALDVLVLIYQNTDQLTRQKHFESLLQHYYDVVETELVNSRLDIKHILNWDEFNSSVVEIAPMAKLLAISTRLRSALVVTTAPYKGEQFGEICFEQCRTMVAKVLKNDKNYKAFVIDILDDVKVLLKHHILSIEDCHKIIKTKLSTTDYHLIEYEVMPITTLGLLGNYYSLTIKFKHTTQEIKELVLFVKRMPNNDYSKQYLLECQAFYKEVQFYTEIVPLMLTNDINCIKRCLSNVYLARNNELLVFDDYYKMGYACLSLRYPYYYATLKLILQKLAVFHASGFVLEETLSESRNLAEIYKTQLQEAKFYESEHNWKFKNNLVKRLWRLITTSSCITPDLCTFHESYEKLFEDVYISVQPSKKYRNTICHADLWTPNILLKIENNKAVDCIFVDFQYCRYGPPAQDVMSLLYFTTNRNFRVEYLQEMLNFYHKALSEVLAIYKIDCDKIVPYKQFLESCSDMKRFAVAQASLLFQQIVDYPVLSKECFVNSSPIEKDEVFTEKLLDTFADLKEVCEPL